jgi:ABC-type multidrug transport system ATPase subunit
MRLADLVVGTPPRRWSTPSTGLKQRLGLARGTDPRPKHSRADEPASGLDPRVRVEIRELCGSGAPR